MWFNNLPKEDKKYLVDAFAEDGFTVNQTKSSLVAEKEGQKIIITNLEQAKITLDFRKWLHRHALLATKMGGIDFSTLKNFLFTEKKEKESAIDCMKRIAPKFNWGTLYSGSEIIDTELQSMLGEEVKFVEIETDNADVFSLLCLTDENGYERVYGVNQKFRHVYRLMQAFNRRDEFRDLAPKAYLALQALGQY